MTASANIKPRYDKTQLALSSAYRIGVRIDPSGHQRAEHSVDETDLMIGQSVQVVENAFDKHTEGLDAS